jgi:hypothetical protein
MKGLCELAGAQAGGKDVGVLKERFLLVIKQWVGEKMVDIQSHRWARSRFYDKTSWKLCCGGMFPISRRSFSSFIPLSKHQQDERAEGAMIQ